MFTVSDGIKKPKKLADPDIVYKVVNLEAEALVTTTGQPGRILSLALLQYLSTLSADCSISSNLGKDR